MTLHLVIRADGDGAVGSGHVVRSLAVAKEWRRRGWHVTWVTSQMSSRLRHLVEETVDEVVHVHDTRGSPGDVRSLLAHCVPPPAWVLLDGYGFSTAYQEALVQQGHRLAILDDHGRCGPWHAELIVDQNLGAGVDTYAAAPAGTRLLLGPRYALVHASPASAQEVTEERRQGIIITLGASAPPDLVEKVMNTTAAVMDEAVTVVLTGDQPELEQLQESAQRLGIEVVLELPPQEMAARLARARLGVLAGGTTNWEACAAGLPRIIVAWADNQRPVAMTLQEKEVAWAVDPQQDTFSDSLSEALCTLLEDPARLDAMGRAARGCVDGEGARRVVDEMVRPLIVLREWRPEDARLLWSWVNDEGVRRSSLRQDPIPWEEHERWFDQRLHDPATVAFIAQFDDDTPVGQVRFDEVEDHRFEVDVTVAPEHRKQRLAVTILSEAVARLHEMKPEAEAIALVRPENLASIRSFEAAGFRRQGTVTRKNVDTLCFMMEPAGAGDLP